MKRNQVMDRTWLERARREKGFTQEQVAEATESRMACSPPALSPAF